MNTIAESYRVNVDIPGLGVVLMHPANNEFKWSWKQKKGYRFYQLVLETKLIFVDAPSQGLFDFTKLANLDRSGMTCERVNVSFDRYCECDNTWSNGFYRGYLKLSQANQWDFELCQVELPVVVDDGYGCLTSNWTKDFNMLEYGDPAEAISPFIGVVQIKQCESDFYEKTWKPPFPSQEVIRAFVRQHWYTHYQIQCLDDVIPPSNHPWTILKHTYYFQLWITPGDLFHGPRMHGRWKIRSKWAREFYAGVVMPPGLLWEPCTGGFHRPVAIANDGVFKWSDPAGQEVLKQEWPNIDGINDSEMWRFKVVGLDGNGNSTLTNGKSMGPVIQDWLDRICPGITLVSNFYNINPDGSNPVNDYYQRRTEDFDEIFLFQITDVARLDESVSATKALLKLKELIDTLNVPHNIDLELNSDGTILRLEHKSYWSSNVGQDLTLPNRLDANGRHVLEGTFKYDYDNETQPNKETFGWSQETDKEGGDFDGYPIEYKNACVDDRDEEQVGGFRSNKFLTNIAFVTGNPDFFDSKEILMVATRNGIVEFKEMPDTPGDTYGSFGPVYRLNGALALKYCLPRYHDYARPFKRGFINKIEVDLFAQLRQKKQVPISFNLSCLDYRDNFKATEYIKTQLGAGQIEAADWIEPAEQMTVILKHK